jgi:hypothetical protein
MYSFTFFNAYVISTELILIDLPVRIVSGIFLFAVGKGKQTNKEQ